jgi:AcrR family transcriptional regulator
MASAKKARKPEDKEARRKSLLLVASSMFDAIPYAKITMADVAERAGLAKGTVYLYFDSKEELFLGVLEERLFTWFSAVDAQLDRLRRDLDANRFIEILTSSDDGS